MKISPVSLLNSLLSAYENASQGSIFIFLFFCCSSIFIALSHPPSSSLDPLNECWIPSLPSDLKTQLSESMTIGKRLRILEFLREWIAESPLDFISEPEGMLAKTLHFLASQSSNFSYSFNHQILTFIYLFFLNFKGLHTPKRLSSLALSLYHRVLGDHEPKKRDSGDDLDENKCDAQKKGDGDGNCEGKENGEKEEALEEEVSFFDSFTTQVFFLLLLFLFYFIYLFF